VVFTHLCCQTRAVDAHLRTFQRRLRQERERLGLTQERASDLVRVSEKHYQALEASKDPNPTFKTLLSISHGFGISLCDLIGCETLKPARVGRPRRQPD
jgi:transcriptional regulator with XRE-family HTH domain